MKKFKEEKGITLVALIITIVVLLILAVVAIGEIQDSNIIGHAQNAAGSFNQAKMNEITELKNTEEYINFIIHSNNEEEIITTEYIKNNIKAILKRSGEKHEITILNNTAVMIGPIEIVFVTNIDYTINNLSGESNLFYVLSKKDNTVMPFAFSADKTKIYMGEVHEDKKVLDISDSYME